MNIDLSSNTDPQSVLEQYQSKHITDRLVRLAIMTDQYLTLVEIAERIGSSKVTVRRYLDAHRFPHARREVGRADGRWLVPWDDVVESGLARRVVNTERIAESSRNDQAILLESLVRTIESQAQTIERLTRALEELGHELGDSNGS